MAATPTLIHVESMHTAVPTRVMGAERSRSLPIAVSGPPLTAAALQRCFRAVLYYRGADGAELEAAARARLERAVWVKESLSAALTDHPEMAGRLRRCGSGGEGPWEVKLNDTGVRLVQASVDTTVAAFLEAKDRERTEAALAMWTDVDVQEPEICAPFFMQLTRFQDGGYAIGVSCSVLLTDPLSLVNFLKSWARMHAQLQAQSKLVANPVIQYTRYIQSPGAVKRLKSVPLVSAAADATTVLFKAAVAPDRRALAAACIDQASEKLGVKKPSRFTVLAGGDSGGLNVQMCTRGDGETPPPSRGHALRAADWHEFGLEEIVLDGSKPVHVSYNVISPCAEEGLVVVMPAAAGGAELLISATVHN